MIKIVTDSSSDIPADLVEEHDLSVVPLTIRFGDDEYVDGVDLSATEFWSKLAASSSLPETAAPSAGAFLDRFMKLADSGATGILAICLSSELSATYQSAVIAAEKFTDVPVRVVDSRSVSMALGLQVLDAAVAANDGGDLDRVAAVALSASASTNIFAALDTLEFLRRGGRIGGAQALLGSILNVKPLITFADGVVAPAGRVRTRSRAKEALATRARELSPRLRRLAILQGGSADIGEFTELITAAAGGIEPIVAELGPVVGTHSGPGVLGIAYHLG